MRKGKTKFTFPEAPDMRPMPLILWRTAPTGTVVAIIPDLTGVLATLTAVPTLYPLVGDPTLS